MSNESEYKEIRGTEDLALRKEYLALGKGLQKVDGLHTSEYYDEITDDVASGKYDISAACLKIEERYNNLDGDSPEMVTKEPDISASRIALVLEKGGFKFSPLKLKSIHEELFHDVLPYKWVGVFRTVNIEKAERILNGRSVEYADYNSIFDTLKYDFDEQKNVQHSLPFDSAQIESLADFVSNIWQTHPFREGNTRTIATFLIMYLRNLGIDIDNEPFKEHADFFRNALVRSNYSNVREGIQIDKSFLRTFFEHLHTIRSHNLADQDLRCQQLFK